MNLILFKKWNLIDLGQGPLEIKLETSELNSSFLWFSAKRLIPNIWIHYWGTEVAWKGFNTSAWILIRKNFLAQEMISRRLTKIISYLNFEIVTSSFQKFYITSKNLKVLRKWWRHGNYVRFTSLLVPVLKLTLIPVKNDIFWIFAT